MGFNVATGLKYDQPTMAPTLDYSAHRAGVGFLPSSEETTYSRNCGFRDRGPLRILQSRRVPKLQEPSFAMEIVITAVGPDNVGLADPIIHEITGRGARYIAEIQMYDHDEAGVACDVVSHPS